MQIDYEKYARIFKVMSDPKRLKIIDMLSEGELCACKILEEFHITQPTLSHDMKLMCDLGIVKARKEGKWMQYSLDIDVMNEVYKTVEGNSSDQVRQRNYAMDYASIMGYGVIN